MPENNENQKKPMSYGPNFKKGLLDPQERSTLGEAERLAFMDVRAGYLELEEALDAAYKRVMSSGTYILGKEVEDFEEKFAAFCGTRYGIGVSSGLDALQLILQGLGIGDGDEVIVPAHTYIATWFAVSCAGATPVPAECDARTFNLDPAAVASKITPKTKAVMAVHLYGQPAEMEALRGIAARHGLKLIEDASQAHGAFYRGRPVGGLSDAAAFSLFPSKNLGAFGDAGIVTTQDEGLAQKIRKLRNYGSRVKYVHELVGCNSRLSPLQAAFLKVKLGRLPEWNRLRAERAAQYIRLLSGYPKLKLPEVPEHVRSAWHLFVVRVSARERLRHYLDQQGISTLIHYPVPCHLQEAYRSLGYSRGDFPVTEAISDEVISLPIFPQMPLDQVDRVAEAIEKFYRGETEF